MYRMYGINVWNIYGINVWNDEHLWDLATVKPLMNLAKDGGKVGWSKSDSSARIYEIHITRWYTPSG